MHITEHTARNAVVIFAEGQFDLSLFGNVDIVLMLHRCDAAVMPHVVTISKFDFLSGAGKNRLGNESAFFIVEYQSLFFGLLVARVKRLRFVGASTGVHNHEHIGEFVFLGDDKRVIVGNFAINQTNGFVCIAFDIFWLVNRRLAFDNNLPLETRPPLVWTRFVLGLNA